jgi:2-polyprenyl-6-methoxyphenol hydroxylase-like FAD-dependent oxidoreductase
LLEQKRPDVSPVSNAKQTASARWDKPLRQADIVIVGAGLAGSLAALVLARGGKRVVIIDHHAIYPRDFRCEKLSPTQMALMRELGVLDHLSDVTRQFDQILVARSGQSTGTQRQEERGLAYSDMVNRLRQAWPPEVDFLEGRVAAVTTSPRHQRVILANGGVIDTRLIVLATGPRDKLPTNLGFTRQLIRRTHSFCIGFGVTPAVNSSFPFQSLTYFGEQAGDRIGYATFFPMLEGMRVNLFCYHEKRATWINEFRYDPAGKLREAMPGLGRLLGDFTISTPVDIRPIDLYVTTNCHRDGIVLIGDAFQSSCPATGSGVTRLLMDVRQLCLIHAPRWFASSGMDAGKIASFYNDPMKRTCDDLSSRAAERGRHLAIETGLRWRLERMVLFLASRFLIVRKLAALLRRRHSIMS